MRLDTYTRPTKAGAHPLTAVIRDVVLDADRNRPRSLQRALGPSELGEPCARRLAYKLMDHPTSNNDSDPWASIVGTSVHAWLADAFLAANTRLGRIRYLVEQRLSIRDGLSGSCDLYDADTATVIDHKVVGTTSMRDYRTHGPLAAYKAQIHLYGMGFARLGLPVKEVVLAFYPRGGTLSGLYVWGEPYDPTIATTTLARHDRLLEVVCAIDAPNHVAAYQQLPRVVGHRCTWCPWLRPGKDTGNGCPGHLEATAPPETWS